MIAGQNNILHHHTIQSLIAIHQRNIQSLLRLSLRSSSFFSQTDACIFVQLLILFMFRPNSISCSSASSFLPHIPLPFSLYLSLPLSIHYCLYSIFIFSTLNILLLLFFYFSVLHSMALGEEHSVLLKALEK